MTPADALRAMLDALAVGPGRIPDTVDGRAVLCRSLLADRRMLILLDNVRDAEQVRPLLPGSASCLVLVTSRDHLGSLVAQEVARPVRLGVFTDQEAAELLAARLGAAKVAAEPGVVVDLIEFCARLPLALSVVAAQETVNPDFSLADLLGELRAEQRVLDAFEAGDSSGSVRAVFSWSLRTLAPDVARLFRLLGLHLGPDFGLRTAASLADVPPSRARQLLAQLVRAHLVDQYSPGRFRLHDLVRAYAAELVDESADRTERSAAERRMLDFLLHTRLSAAVVLNPHRDPQYPPPPLAGAAYVPVADTDEAFRWYNDELATLLAAARHAANGPLVSCAWQIPWCMTSFLNRRGRWAAVWPTTTAAWATSTTTSTTWRSPSRTTGRSHCGENSVPTTTRLSRSSGWGMPRRPTATRPRRSRPGARHWRSSCDWTTRTLPRCAPDSRPSRSSRPGIACAVSASRIGAELVRGSPRSAVRPARRPGRPARRASTPGTDR